MRELTERMPGAQRFLVQYCPLWATSVGLLKATHLYTFGSLLEVAP